MCSNCVQNREHVEFVAEQMNTSERVRENYREQGRCQERQRIIELLEKHDVCDFCEIITLIKGEANE